MDDVDGFECQCQDGFSGDHCQCSGGQDDTEDIEDEYQDMSNMTCIDVNTTLSWTIPPDYLPDLYDDHLYDDGDTTTEDAISVVHVVDVDVTVGYEDVIHITASVEDIDPTPSFTIPSSDVPFLGIDIGRIYFITLHYKLNLISINIEGSCYTSICMS